MLILFIVWNETGDSSLNVIAIRASIHLPFDHHLLVQNLSTQVMSCWISK